MAIKYHDLEVSSKLKNKRKLSAFIQKKAFEYLAIKSMEINYVFCTDEYLLEKNIAFLNHDTLTDILTFDLSEGNLILNAEIYISIDRVKENAETLNIPYQEELHRVIFHGLLHLCGFKDKSKDDALLMRQKEQECLNQYTP